MNQIDAHPDLNRAMTLVLIVLDKQTLRFAALRSEMIATAACNYHISEESLYHRLSRLKKLGYIEDTPTPDGEPQDDRYRYFRITTCGRQALAAELQRLENLIRVAQAGA